MKKGSFTHENNKRTWNISKPTDAMALVNRNSFLTDYELPKDKQITTGYH